MTRRRSENPSDPSGAADFREGYEGYEGFPPYPIVRLFPSYTAGGDGKPLGPHEPLGCRGALSTGYLGRKMGCLGYASRAFPWVPASPLSRARTRASCGDCTARVAAWGWA